MNSKLAIIISREYTERVARKSFIFTTLLMPIFMVAMMVLPALIMMMSGPESKTIAVIDNSGVVMPQLKGNDDIKFTGIESNVTVDSVRGSNDFDALLIIGSDVVDRPDNVNLYTKGAPSIQTESYIRHLISDAVSDQRIKKYDIDNIRQIIADIDVDVTLNTYRLDSEETEETSSMVSYFIGLIMMFMLYMFLLLYGQMVMTSIIEEKNNRVLELIVSSVKPTVLMLGKIIGIALVAITQIVIWAVLIGSVSKWVMPLMASGMSTADAELTSAFALLSNVGYIMGLFGYILVFLVLGFLFYAAIYAAIGSAVDNIQDASQLTMIPTLPIILGIMFSMTALSDPNSSMAFWMSITPFTSPMVMLCRIPFGIPTWEILLSIGVLIVSSLFVVWLAAKIYRVGIFMYGKKPTVKDLIRWAKYK